MVEYDSWSSYVLSLSDSPESNVLLTTWDKAIAINWTKLDAKNIKFRSLFRGNLGLLAAVDLWNIPNYYHLFVVVVFANRSEPLAIRWECNTFQTRDGHCDHWDAPTCVVIPNSDDWVFSFLGWGKHSSVRCNIETANGCRVTKEKSLLLPSLRVHSNQTPLWRENDNAFTLNSWPLNIQTFIRWVAYNVLELHYGIKV